MDKSALGADYFYYALTSEFTGTPGRLNLTAAVSRPVI